MNSISVTSKPDHPWIWMSDCTDAPKSTMDAFKVTQDFSLLKRMQLMQHMAQLAKSVLNMIACKDEPSLKYCAAYHHYRGRADIERLLPSFNPTHVLNTTFNPRPTDIGSRVILLVSTGVSTPHVRVTCSFLNVRSANRWMVSELGAQCIDHHTVGVT